jgi:hypothetical protein
MLASRSENTSLQSLNTIIGVMGINRFNTHAASMPFITGIERSSNDQIWAEHLSHFDRFLSVLCLSAYLEIALRIKQETEHTTDDFLVVCDQY